MTSRQQRNGRPAPARIGGPLRKLLDERFIAHAELAQAIGVHERNVSRWVSNTTGPQKRQVRKIAEFFGIEPSSLIEPEPDDELEVAA